MVDAICGFPRLRERKSHQKLRWEVEISCSWNAVMRRLFETARAYAQVHEKLRSLRLRPLRQLKAFEAADYRCIQLLLGLAIAAEKVRLRRYFRWASLYFGL